MSELKKLEFSKPITRYESTAIYDNNQGYKVFVKAYGSSKNEIEERTKNLLISLNISTDEILESDTVASLIPEADNRPVLNSEPGISAEAENIEDIIQPLEIFVDSLLLDNINPGSKLKFAFENRLPSIMWRSINDDTLQPIPITTLSREVYKTSPLTKVEAIITVQRGNATFFLYQSTTGQGNWGDYVRKITVSSNSSENLIYRVNQNKYFKLMVQGEPGTNYSITGNWVVT
ncbi:MULTISPECIES: hypothetical protein [unclassified Nostoc]|uniref:hypothetical protein n=1 Tax=unclassified Nostoc TaxID=2593658 RepID=UPI001DC33B74|nr:hypothetical protein [Nostoc sp. JL34]MBN3882487.1 hypothetical protein [Nostoc sp. JL34]